MRIITAQGEFDLPAGFTTEVTTYNPAFNETGEQSLPMTLPPTYKNLKLAGFSDVIENYYKPVKELAVDVVSGVFMRPGNLVIHSANTDEGISCTVYFREGQFYSLIEEKNMQDVPLDVIEGIGATTEDKVLWLVNYLKIEYTTQDSQVFSVFPVQTQHSVTRKILLEDSLGDMQAVEETFNLVLNGYERKYNFNPANTAEKELMLSQLMGENAQVFIEQNTAVSIGKGYGMTAFVNVFYYLERMFAHFGYDFDDTEVRATFSRADWRIVMLNNVADAIYDGTLDFNQLIPDMSLKEFIRKISAYFGGYFTFSDIEKRATFHLYSNLFAYNPGEDLTHYTGSKPRITGVDFKWYELVNPSADNALTHANRSPIEVNFPVETSYIMIQSHLPDDPRTTYSFNLMLMSVNNIIHRNSVVVKNSEVDEEKETNSSKNLILAGVKKGALYRYVHYVPDVRYPNNQRLVYTLQYYKGYAGVYPDATSALDFLSTHYGEYIAFYKDSNLTVECLMRLPAAILHSLDMTKQYEINGTLYYIDKVVQNLSETAMQKITFRTVRPYADRE